MEITPDKTTIGFIGLGVMGHSMAGHILDAGYKLHVYNRTKSKADDLVEKGAVLEDSVLSLAKKSDVVISIVGFPQDVEQVYLGTDGVLENLKSGSIAIEMTTSDPALAVDLYNKGIEKGIHVLDAPVSGGDLGARNAALSIMVGGDNQVFDMVLPVFEIMGKNIVYQGKAGAGQHTKVANQIAISAGMVAMCESIAYATKAGLDPEAVIACIGKGAAGSWSLNNLGPRIIRKDDQPGFFIKHFIKDMGIASDSSKTMGLDTPGLDLALSLYKKMVEKGFENNGTQALYKLYQ
jgi:3-hydroxyisobutyrate dehydrogenase